ncbi:tripartite tricarboxylate transporter TctB family protein [Kineococcus gynurae]|uniref:Tripartite tricarboxylate transporter TctB family protein n=1 Tax=Kineococcus gynurae TaxID=452979 RepID=A0ABV5LSL7_9ACTN
MSAVGSAVEIPVARRRLRPSEFVFPLAVIGLGVFTLVETSQIAVGGMQNAVGPRVFPTAVGILLVATGLGVVLAVLTGRVGEVEDSEDVDASARTDWGTVAKLAGSFLALIVLVEPLGWPIAATVLFGGTAWALGARPVWRPFVVGAVIAVVVHVLFTQVLDLYLPAGPLSGVIGFG